MTMQTAFETYRDSIALKRTQDIQQGGISNWDGRAVWQPTKNALSEDAGDQQWASVIGGEDRKAFYDRVMQLPEFDEDGKVSELNHFIMQCVRIPINEGASPRKIMQVALNIGQLISEVELIGELDSEFKELMTEFYRLGMTEFEAYM